MITLSTRVSTEFQASVSLFFYSYFSDLGLLAPHVGISFLNKMSKCKNRGDNFSCAIKGTKKKEQKSKKQKRQTNDKHIARNDREDIYIYIFL